MALILLLQLYLYRRNPCCCCITLFQLPQSWRWDRNKANTLTYLNMTLWLLNLLNVSLICLLLLLLLHPVCDGIWTLCGALLGHSTWWHWLRAWNLYLRAL